MSNYNINANLLKLHGAFVRKIEGKNETKECIIIPIDDAGLVLGKKGVYLNMTAIEMKEPKFEDTHCIVPDLPKALRDSYAENGLTPENIQERHPALGGLKEQVRKEDRMQVTKTIGQESFVNAEDDDDDLPF